MDFTKIKIRSLLAWLLVAALWTAYWPALPVGLSLYLDHRDQAALEAKIRHDLKKIAEAAKARKAAAGSYPDSVDDLTVTESDDSDEGGAAAGGSGFAWRMLDISETVDPWNRTYLLETDGGGRLHIRCLGKDGEPGGEGEDRDRETVLEK